MSKKKRNALLMFGLLALALMLRLSGGASAMGITFTVTSTDDVDDNTCNATHCSLREAINAANGLPGTDAIEFTIPGQGPHTIRPLSALPAITDPVVIDGYTQLGASSNTNPPGFGSNAVLKIELDGSNAGGGVNGLLIIAGHSTVRGLVINRFSRNGIHIITNGGNAIEGNFLGTDVTGSLDLGNAEDGVDIRGPNNTVGGTTVAALNIISGNGVRGVVIQGSSGINGGNFVQGNLIGTDVTGTAALGNTQEGVVIRGEPNNTIGGTNAEARNIISGNRGGVWIRNLISLGITHATGNVVLGNFIGADVTGTAALGNASDGIVIETASDNLVGGKVSGASNTIAYNGDEGVNVITIDPSFGTGNAFLSNAIFANNALGIDLRSQSMDGVTLNDPGDGDAGANNLQNFPILTSASSSSSGTTIVGMLDSSPNSAFRLEFFSNSACDRSGFGEGETFLGSTMVTTDIGGNASFMVTIPTTVVVGHFATATATDPGNNTSEFSQCATVEVPKDIIDIDIDIKPGSDPNSIHCNNANRVIPVAILTTDGFDATTVDHTTVTFEGSSETHVHQQSGQPQRHEEDVDRDGDVDLVFHFRLGGATLTCDSVEAALIGETFSGQSIQGTDSINMVVLER